MIQNVIFGILFMKILFLAYNFFIFAQMYQRPSSAEFLFNFRFSIRKSQSQQKLGKKIAHFRIQFRSKNITHFTNLDSLTLKTICSCNTPKSLSDMFLLDVGEKICTAPFLDTQELDF